MYDLHFCCSFMKCFVSNSVAVLINLIVFCIIKRKWDFIMLDLFFFIHSDKMSQWCVFPISWHLNILGNYVITRYYRVFGVVFTEIYRIIWKKKIHSKNCHSLNRMLLHICLFHPFANIQMQLVWRIFTYIHLISNKKWFYLRFHLTVWLPFLLFIRIICKLSTKWITACFVWKKFTLPSFNFHTRTTVKLNATQLQHGTDRLDTIRLVIHWNDWAQLTSINFIRMFIFLMEIFELFDSFSVQNPDELLNEL